MNVVIDKIPKEMGIKNSEISFKDFGEKFIDYMQNIEDIENLINEMTKFRNLSRFMDVGKKLEKNLVFYKKMIKGICSGNMELNCHYLVG